MIFEKVCRIYPDDPPEKLSCEIHSGQICKLEDGSYGMLYNVSVGYERTFPEDSPYDSEGPYWGGCRVYMLLTLE